MNNVRACPLLNSLATPYRQWFHASIYHWHFPAKNLSNVEAYTHRRIPLEIRFFWCNFVDWNNLTALLFYHKIYRVNANRVIVYNIIAVKQTKGKKKEKRVTTTTMTTRQTGSNYNPLTQHTWTLVRFVSREGLRPVQLANSLFLYRSLARSSSSYFNWKKKSGIKPWAGQPVRRFLSFQCLPSVCARRRIIKVNDFVWTWAHVIQKLRTNKPPCYSISFIYCIFFRFAVCDIRQLGAYHMTHKHSHTTVRHERNQFNSDVFSATKDFLFCVLCTFNQFDQWTMTPPISNFTSNYTSIRFITSPNVSTHTNMEKRKQIEYYVIQFCCCFVLIHFLRRNVKIFKMPCLYCNVNKFVKYFPLTMNLMLVWT